MKRNVARRYARDAVCRCIEHFMEDTEWLEERFSEEDLRRVVAEIETLRKQLLYKSTDLPEPLEGRIRPRVEAPMEPSAVSSRSESGSGLTPDA